MKKIFVFLMLSGMAACTSHHAKSDASGTFEVDETIISSEAAGSLKQFNIEEGQYLKAGQVTGYVDSTQLYLRKKQLQAQIKVVLSSLPDSQKQLAILEEQLQSAEREQRRFTNLIQSNAGTRKQLDDINTQVEVIKKQIEAQRSTLGITSSSIIEQTVPLRLQIAQLDDQLDKCKLINPLNGTVLTKYAMQDELAAPGKPLYKIANLSELVLRAYITSTQLSEVKLNQKVKVLTDKSASEYNEHEGTIIWISDKAEFTPKTIQTKDERANLVYAVKMKVPNQDGTLKIGMYGEVEF